MLRTGEGAELQDRLAQCIRTQDWPLVDRHPVDRGQVCRGISHNSRDSPAAENYLPPNANSTMVKKLS